MFISKCLVSKKGPLGAIWVAAYFFKKLKKSQISGTNISSSVDDILQNQLEILAYRVLAYLLLGVVRIYSKKVEYLFDDCQELLIKINEFVVREKNRAKKEALRSASFSITRPVCFELDAFDLEVLEDTSRDNEVPREEITLKDVAWTNAGTMQYSLDRIAALDDAFLIDYIPPEHSLSCHLMTFETEARALHDVCESEASMEKLRCDTSIHEEVSHLKMVCRVEEEPLNIVKVFDKNEREHLEVPDMSGLENCTVQEANREKINDRLLSEECLSLRFEAAEDSSGPFKLNPFAKDQTTSEMIEGPDLLESEKELNQAMEEDHACVLEASAWVPDLAGSSSREKSNDRFSSEEGMNLHPEAEEEPLIPVESLVEDLVNREKMGLLLPQSENEVYQVLEEDHVSMKASKEVPGIASSENRIGREASRENHNDEFCQEECLNLIVEVEEKSPAFMKSFGEEQTSREKKKGSDRVQPENEVHHFMEEGCNSGASVKKLQAEGFSDVDLQEPSTLVRPLAEENQTDAENGKFPAMRTSKDGKCQVAAKDHPLSVTLDTNPLSMLRDASGATTPHFMLIPTPAKRERARFSRKRKCLFDEVIVFPNDIMRQWIKDASDLVSKGRKDGHTALGARRTWISSLPQGFLEPSVPCTSELKSIYSGKRLRILKSVNIIKPPEQMDTSEPPAVDGSFEQAELTPATVEMRDPPVMLNLSKSPLFDGSSEQAGIAPQTPIRQSTSLVVGEQTEIAPQTPVLYSKSLRHFGSPKDLKFYNLDVGPENVDPTQSMKKEPSLNEIVEESSLNKNEDLDLNLDMHSNEDDNQGQADGWSSRTRMVAERLQMSFLDQREKKEEKVNLSQLLEGKTKKASVRLFYEILVLKSTGLVDVQQEEAFSDIVVVKGPKWEEMVFCLGRHVK
ncbi:sister chromatid cohesion 1 protein 2 isoform X1 [Gossypium hirsutum]|uniref:Sister chromatid cohesion 1 protein 2 isoform X1 n=2 Tax=Gossypium hirsutum TaxID=3635 RepID=A0ABM3BLU1_GOSHI|nr:sister chromatid cohesion 1 protein 2 isoform X1 [Gossypium hirsutum]